MPFLTGSFLVAKPTLHDPSFRRTVVLLLQHNEDGAFGLVVNRPSKVDGLPFPLYAGGPCESEGLLMLHGHKDWSDDPPEEPSSKVAPGIFLGDAACLERVSDIAPGHKLRFRLFAGYSGWGPDQLEGELAEGVWAVVPATGKLLSARRSRSCGTGSRRQLSHSLASTKHPLPHEHSQAKGTPFAERARRLMEGGKHGRQCE
jgi:putative transcriptional regulator